MKFPGEFLLFLGLFLWAYRGEVRPWLVDTYETLAHALGQLATPTPLED